MKILPIITLLSISLSFTHYTHAQTNITDTIVYGIWTKDNSPYKIFCDIAVPTDSSLVIGEGVTVEFQGNYQFSIYGEFHVNGTPNEKVLFTINDTSGFSDPETTAGGWRGIYAMYGTYIPYSMNHAIIEFVKNLEPGLLLYGKKGGGALGFSGKWSVTISNTEIRNNFSVNRGGGIAFLSSQIRLDKVFIHNNKALDVGGGIYSVLGNLYISNSIICNNTATEGGGFYQNYQKFYIVNCLFANNEATEETNEIKLYFGHDSTKIFANTIIWNEYEDRLIDTDSETHFSNCIISNLNRQLWAEFENCYDVNPLFNNPTTGIGAGFPTEISDWIIPATSEALDFGVFDTLAGSTDILHNPRVYADTLGIIDIGPFECQAYPFPRKLVFDKESSFGFRPGEFCGKFTTYSNIPAPYTYSFSSNDSISGKDSVSFELVGDSLFYKLSIPWQQTSTELVVRSADSLNQFIEMVIEFDKYDLIAGLCDNEAAPLVYPNPTTGLVNISKNAVNPSRVDVYNIQGELVRSYTSGNTPLTQIDLSPFENEWYYLKLYSATETTTFRILKME